MEVLFPPAMSASVMRSYVISDAFDLLRRFHSGAAPPERGQPDAQMIAPDFAGKLGLSPVSNTKNHFTESVKFRFNEMVFRYLKSGIPGKAGARVGPIRTYYRKAFPDALK